jgi:uncharacterized DUF497 family protein
VYVEYDPAKNAINRRKHRIDLEDDKAVLFDPMALVREDGGTEDETGSWRWGGMPSSGS